MSDNNKNTSQYRPPVVTIMGHVDHGKTSILDVIRKTNVTSGELGGITQHIGAYQITHNGNPITFIDTPGHAAFTQMRARGGKVADIIIIVVAADDGVMPQTIEAIKHAKASGSPIIVALNKIDLPTANPDKVIQGLAEHNLVVEAWGGDVVMIKVSAKTGEGLSELLDAIQLTSELQGFRNDPTGEMEAYIIEAKKDSKKGILVNAIVKNGTIKIGDKLVASGTSAKVRALTDDKGKSITQAGPSQPVEIFGFKQVPNAGGLILHSDSELAELSLDEDRVEIIGQNTSKTLSIILRADTQGTLEAIKMALAVLVTSSAIASFSIKFTRVSTGDISSSDVMMAQGLKAIILGFNVKVPSIVADQAAATGVQIKTYKTIYDLVGAVESLLDGYVLREEEKIKGRAEVLKVFELPSGDVIAGVNILAGKLLLNLRIAVYSKDPSNISEFDEPIIYGIIKKLKRGKEDVIVVNKDIDCGILLSPESFKPQVGYYIEGL